MLAITSQPAPGASNFSLDVNLTIATVGIAFRFR